MPTYILHHMVFSPCVGLVAFYCNVSVLTVNTGD